MPAGREPALIDQVYVGVPPVAPSEIAEYPMPTSPLWNGKLVIARAAISAPIRSGVYGKRSAPLLSSDNRRLGTGPRIIA